RHRTGLDCRAARSTRITLRLDTRGVFSNVRRLPGTTPERRRSFPMTMTATERSRITSLLGADADNLLNYTAKGVNKSTLHLPGPDFVDRVVSQTDRKPAVLRNFEMMLNHGRLGGTGY